MWCFSLPLPLPPSSLPTSGQFFSSLFSLLFPSSWEVHPVGHPSSQLAHRSPSILLYVVQPRGNVQHVPTSRQRWPDSGHLVTEWFVHVGFLPRPTILPHQPQASLDTKNSCKYELCPFQYHSATLEKLIGIKLDLGIFSFSNFLIINLVLYAPGLLLSVASASPLPTLSPNPSPSPPSRHLPSPNLHLLLCSIPLILCLLQLVAAVWWFTKSWSQSPAATTAGLFANCWGLPLWGWGHVLEHTYIN